MSNRKQNKSSKDPLPELYPDRSASRSASTWNLWAAIKALFFEWKKPRKDTQLRSDDSQEDLGVRASARSEPPRVSTEDPPSTPDRVSLAILTERMDGLERRIIAIEFKLELPEEPSLENRSRKTAGGSEHYQQSGDSDYYRLPQGSIPAYNSTSHRSIPPPATPVDFESFERAVCRFLEKEHGSWGIERLRDVVQGTTHSHASLELQHLGPQRSGEWRLAILWHQSAQEGLALVSPGELVDEDIARYFDVGFGRRIIACRKPARVSRRGNELTVVRKGKVESS